MSFQFGSSKQKSQGAQTISLPAATPEETELKKLNLELAKRQIAEMDKASAQQATFETSPTGQAQKELEALATQNLLARAKGTAPVLSPEAQARVSKTFGATQAQGETDLMRFAEELAGQRGLRTSDSPIFNEALRQRNVFGQQLAGQQAASELDVGQTEANFNQALRSFQAQLQQQAFMNRMSLAGQTPASFGLQSQLFGERLAQGNQKFSGSSVGTQWGTGVDIARLLAGAGQAGFRLGG